MSVCPYKRTGLSHHSWGWWKYQSWHEGFLSICLIQILDVAPISILILIKNIVMCEVIWIPMAFFRTCLSLYIHTYIVSPFWDLILDRAGLALFCILFIYYVQYLQHLLMQPSILSGNVCSLRLFHFFTHQPNQDSYPAPAVLCHVQCVPHESNFLVANECAHWTFRSQ